MNPYTLTFPFTTHTTSSLAQQGCAYSSAMFAPIMRSLPLGTPKTLRREGGLQKVRIRSEREGRPYPSACTAALDWRKSCLAQGPKGINPPGSVAPSSSNPFRFQLADDGSYPSNFTRWRPSMRFSTRCWSRCRTCTGVSLRVAMGRNVGHSPGDSETRRLQAGHPGDLSQAQGFTDDQTASTFSRTPAPRAARR
jgi:hypothetical protein